MAKLLDTVAIDELEQMIDFYSLESVVNALAYISSLKADHVRVSYAEPGLAKRWERMAGVLERAAEHARKDDF